MYVRYDVYHVYFYVLAFSLLTTGGIALISSAVPSDLHAMVIAPGSALFLALAGFTILSILRHWRGAYFLSLGLLLVMALFQLAESAGSGLPLPGAVGQGAFRIQNALALVGLFVVAACLANSWAPSRKWLSGTLGLAIIVAGVLSQLSYGGYVPESARLSRGLESPINIDLLVVLLGGGMGLLSFLPGRTQRLDRRSILISLGGGFPDLPGGVSAQSASHSFNESAGRAISVQGSGRYRADAFGAAGFGATHGHTLGGGRPVTCPAFLEAGSFQLSSGLPRYRTDHCPG
ncbi:hypothetical protein [Modicisalibacter luteus]|uniref:hypothetical protein n=1 Tax=Modicisalibacter luteus TaxID=453962 RepID=UPI00360CBD8E